MSIVASELVFHGTANHAEDDNATQGGAIDTAKKIEFTQLTGNAVAEVVSDGADVRTTTVYGRLATGARDNEALVNNGATPVAGAKTWERILKATLSAGSGTRTVVLKQGAGGTIRLTLLPNITEVRALFIDSASAAAQTIRYEKFFGKNTHGTLTLNSAAVKLTADPSSKIRIGCAPSKGDTATATNRLTAPASVTFVDDNVSQGVPTGALAAGETIGIWAELTLAADNAALKSTFTVELSGTTT
ncbi:MAG: hypothetical protein HOP28_12195 [Gemmatimonadales bacterium]|nr:hypothetical protein [Gemmatimonadales bacterium]